MSILLISYDLLNPNMDYEPLYQAIYSNSKTWWHFLTNTWLANTVPTATEFAQKLYPHITKSDRLLVIEVKGRGDGWLPKGAWDWIDEQEAHQHSTLLSIIGASQKEPKVVPPTRPPLKDLLPVRPPETSLQKALIAPPSPPPNAFQEAFKALTKALAEHNQKTIQTEPPRKLEEFTKRNPK